MQKVALFMERFWMVLGILSAAWALYALYAVGWEKGRTWLLFPVISFAMWGYRRYMRGKIAQWEERGRASNGKHEP